MGAVRATVVGLVLSLALIVPSVGVALAGPPWPYPPSPLDSGKVGVRDLVDTGEYPGVRCRYSTAGDLVGLRIRRPIAFARDVTGGIDQGRVGWRWEVFGQTGSSSWAFELVERGPLVTASATDARNAHLLPVAVDLGSLGHDVYRVRHTISWYRPGDAGSRVGRAVHWADLDEIDGQTLGPETDWCDRTRLKLVPDVDPPGHTGTYGAHLLVDSGEFPGLTCVDAAEPPYELVRMRAGVAIAFGSRPERRVITRRLLLQSTDDPGADPTWTTRRITEVVSRTATDARNAAFPAVGLRILDGQAHPGWRIVQRLIWTTPDGRADEVSRDTLQDDGDPQVAGETCFGAD